MRGENVPLPRKGIAGMSMCVVPGSFDPVTAGHEDMIRRASRLFDSVRVCVMHNIRKKGAFDPVDRVRMLEKVCEGLPNVTVDLWDGLLADYVKRTGATIILRGARSSLEFENELPYAEANRVLAPEAETLLMPASGGLACVSSSMVREVASFGGDFSAFVPACVLDEIRAGLMK